MTDYNNRHVLYERLRKRFSEEMQLTKALEELAELQKEICKGIYAGVNIDLSNLIDEMADVKIMIEQVAHIFGITEEEIHQRVLYKLSRTEERLLITGHAEEDCKTCEDTNEDCDDCGKTKVRGTNE